MPTTGRQNLSGRGAIVKPTADELERWPGGYDISGQPRQCPENTNAVAERAATRLNLNRAVNRPATPSEGNTP